MDRRYDSKKIGKKIQQIFEWYGLDNGASAIMADIVLSADLLGVKSHGIQRMKMYDMDVLNGVIDVKKQYQIVYDTKLYTKIDANDQLGQLVSKIAMDKAIEKAGKDGIGFVGVQNSSNFGMAGYYSKMAARKDYIGISVTNTPPAMLYPGTKKPIIGTNPIAVCIPAFPYDFLLDMSTTVVTVGTIEMYKKMGKILENNWVLDNNGKNVYDPNLAINEILCQRAGILPLGKEIINGVYKGAGLGVLVELLTAIVDRDFTDTNRISHLFCAIDYEIFGNKKEIKTRFSRILNKIRKTNLDGSDIYLAGELEEKRREENLREGILIDDNTLLELKEIFCRCNIEFHEEEIWK